MKGLVSSIMAALLFTVALACLSPPTQKKDSAALSAVVVMPQAVSTVEQVALTSNFENKIGAQSSDYAIAQPSMRKNEVAARARNGTSTESARAGMVLLL